MADAGLVRCRVSARGSCATRGTPPGRPPELDDRLGHLGVSLRRCDRGEHAGQQAAVPRTGGGLACQPRQPLERGEVGFRELVRDGRAVTDAADLDPGRELEEVEPGCGRVRRDRSDHVRHRGEGRRIDIVLVRQRTPQREPRFVIGGVARRGIELTEQRGDVVRVAVRMLEFGPAG
jgi:hypothetical protein